MNEGSSTSTAERRAELMALSNALRPELHRYGARLMGSIIEGEDVVQDAFARALEAIDEGGEIPPLRGWLFRIAHNRAVDLLRQRTVRATEPIERAEDIVDPAGADPVEALMREQAIETAIERFTALPVTQRGAVILKDVLDLSLREIAGTLDLTVDAVKAHLARGRARLREINARAAPEAPLRPASPNVSRFVSLFNRRDWDGLRAMLAEDVRLIQSTHPPRAGVADVGTFFGIYSRVAPVRLFAAWLGDREVIGVHDEAGSAEPDYLMWLEWDNDRIRFIRDYRHVRYVMEAATLTPALAGDAIAVGPG